MLGVKVARGAPRVNHLLFADDCLIFVKAELCRLNYVKDILKQYELLTGQRINYKKSEIVGSSSIDEFMLRLFGDFLSMETVDAFPKYVGLPVTIGRNRVAVFKWLEDKAQGKINEWNASFLSTAGKETPIKACIQFYPIYPTNCFRFP